jgi:S-adenosylmethionine hydrolase
MTAVTLLTDFGTRDGYAGEIKGVLATRAPEAVLVDIAHDLSPGDVRGAAWVLGRTWTRFPAGTVHLAVVDPGVGGERRPVALRLAERWFVGPDNGLITLARRSHAVAEARQIDPSIGEHPVSDTFHGRDLFAPAAAHLAAGRTASKLGPSIESESIVGLRVPRPARDGEVLRGHVAHVDHFGNLITNLPVEWLPPEPAAELAGTTVTALAASYDAVTPGQLMMSRGSGGTMEISMRDGRACDLLEVERDEPVMVRPAG